MSWETFDDETEGALRDAPPDVLSPINENAPVSGHQAPTSTEALQARAVEHDWEAAADHVYPVLRPAGTQGTKLAEIDSEQLAQEGLKKHALPLIDPGPADLAVAYVLREVAYDILVNADHLLAWGVDAAKLRETAMANLAAWSAHAPWTDELSGSRRLLSSDTGEGSDAARILLEDVRQHLAGECGGPARVLIAVPDRDLLVAGSLNPDDGDFATQFATFVADVADDAHEPIDRGLFELVGDGLDLVRFTPGADAA
ncbi:MAG: DUF1444 family protein [Chloroflexi bacterium]|nr:MAG: DUF1444 family protein [Chloroflexota bacterium]